jgi:hypothetical protein
MFMPLLGHRVEQLFLNYFSTAIYYLMPAALSESCDNILNWDLKWQKWSGKVISVDGKIVAATLPKTIVWSFVLGNQTRFFSFQAVQSAIPIDHVNRMALLRQLDQKMTEIHHLNPKAKCSRQIVNQIRGELFSPSPLSQAHLERFFRVEFKEALEQLLSAGHIDQVMTEEELGICGFQCCLPPTHAVVDDDENSNDNNNNNTQSPLTPDKSPDQSRLLPRLKLYEVRRRNDDSKSSANAKLAQAEKKNQPADTKMTLPIRLPLKQKKKTGYRQRNKQWTMCQSFR